MNARAPDLENLPITVPAVPVVSDMIGMSRSSAYAALQAGTFPVRVLKIGKKYRVSRADLLKFLGEAA